MNTHSENNVYGSGLNQQDWRSLCSILLLFLYTEHPNEVEIPPIPEHLEHHPFIQALRAFQNTSEDRFLDQAGKCLVPSVTEPFGWYAVVTK